MRKDDVAGGVDYYKLIISFVLFCVLVAITTSVALAHKVNIFAYREGEMVYTESYFSDGKKVKDGIVEVYDNQGNKLLEGKTNEKGQFNFKPPPKDNLKIVLSASMGHKNTYNLLADEVSDSVGAEKPQEQDARDITVDDISSIDLDQIEKIIDASLDEKLKPIMRELVKAQQKTVSITEVIGGIGYIFGIMGIILYFASKKKD